jgi:hypothetical protein
MNSTSFGTGLPPGAVLCAEAGCAISNPAQTTPTHRASPEIAVMVSLPRFSGSLRKFDGAPAFAAGILYKRVVPKPSTLISAKPS